MNVHWTGATTHNFCTECVCDGGQPRQDKSARDLILLNVPYVHSCKLRGLATAKTLSTAFDTLVCVWFDLDFL